MAAPPVEAARCATHVLMPFAGGLLAGGLHHAGAFGASARRRARARSCSRHGPGPRDRARRAAAGGGARVGALAAALARSSAPGRPRRAPRRSPASPRWTASSCGATGPTAGSRCVLDVAQAPSPWRDAGRARSARRNDRARRPRMAGRNDACASSVASAGRATSRTPAATITRRALARRGIRVTMFLWDDVDGRTRRRCATPEQASLAQLRRARGGAHRRAHGRAACAATWRPCCSARPRVSTPRRAPRSRAPGSPTSCRSRASTSPSPRARASSCCAGCCCARRRSPLRIDVAKVAAALGLAPRRRLRGHRGRQHPCGALPS